MKITLSAESTIDLPQDLKQKYDIHTTPFTVLLGDELYYDGEIEVEKMFEYTEKTKNLPKTSAVNENQFIEHFEKILQYSDGIIHFSLSSGVSCAYDNAVKASKHFKNVYVIDSKSLSTGIALLAIKAFEMINDNQPLEEIVKKINLLVPKVQASLVINKLDYLRKGGRCSALKCFGANILQLRPQILVKDGKLVPAKKFRGKFENCVKQYCEDILQNFPNFDKSRVFVAYTTASRECVEIAKKLLKEAGFENVIENRTGATISTHCGPNALGILYLTN